MKNIHFDKFIISADVGIFLDKTEQHHLVTKIMLFGDVVLISDAELSTDAEFWH